MPLPAYDWKGHLRVFGGQNTSPLRLSFEGKSLESSAIWRSPFNCEDPAPWQLGAPGVDKFSTFDAALIGDHHQLHKVKMRARDLAVREDGRVAHLSLAGVHDLARKVLQDPASAPAALIT